MTDDEVQPPGFGWAPGDYFMQCMECGSCHSGCDKRAIRCKACAQKMKEEVCAEANRLDAAIASGAYVPLVFDDRRKANEHDLTTLRAKVAELEEENSRFRSYPSTAPLWDILNGHKTRADVLQSALKEAVEALEPFAGIVPSSGRDLARARAAHDRLKGLADG